MRVCYCGFVCGKLSVCGVACTCCDGRTCFDGSKRWGWCFDRGPSDLRIVCVVCVWCDMICVIWCV